MATESVWGLDIGQCALKAVKARVTSGQAVEIMAFDHIEYRSPLSTAGTDANATIREALQTFLSRNDVLNCKFSVAIAAGRSALIRFGVKLPPVDRKKVPDLVKYEASQQIPFPLEDVVWDYQVIDRQYAPGEELEVGIFAMRRDAIFDFLSNLILSGIEVDSIQLPAVALYNAVRHDTEGVEGAVMAVDIGAESTNFDIVDGSSVGARSLPVGGNDFTRAIAGKFNLQFEEAEKLKRSMDRSKKANEIFEALRPSVKNLLDEIQKFGAYYRSTHKSAKFIKLVGFGGGFRMYGLQRFLEASLSYPVEAFEKTGKIGVERAMNLQFFKKSSTSFGTAMGLAVQALGKGGINTTLMPPAILQERMFRKKKPYLAASAAVLAASFLLGAVLAYSKPTEYVVSKHPSVRDFNERLGKMRKYDENINVDETTARIATLIDSRKGRGEQVEVFKSLMASIPRDPQYPIFVERIALGSGNAEWIAKRLASAAGANSALARNPYGGVSVEAPNYIDEAATSGPKRGATADFEAAAKADDERRRMQDEAEERRIARRMAQANGEGRSAPVPGGVRDESLQVKFDGVAYLANITIETANPKGDSYISDICQQIKKTPGVLHCEYFYIQPMDYWEDPATRARVSVQPAGEGVNLFPVKTVYRSAGIQWVYKPGGQGQIVKGGAAPGPVGEGEERSAAPVAPRPAAPAAPAAPAKPAGRDIEDIMNADM